MMKEDKKNRQLAGRSMKEWEALVERYFDALTTDEEERELVSFLASSEAVGKVFDEARAVIGFLKVGRSMHRSQPESFLRKPVWKVAAVVCGLAFGASFWFFHQNGNDVCEAYVYGKKYTEEALVMSHVRTSVEQMNMAMEVDVVERQLGDIFTLMDDSMDKE